MVRFQTDFLTEIYKLQLTTNYAIIEESFGLLQYWKHMHLKLLLNNIAQPTCGLSAVDPQDRVAWRAAVRLCRVGTTPATGKGVSR